MDAHTSTGTRAAEGRPAVILQVLPGLGAGGVEQGTVDIAAAIAEHGDVPLVASSGGPKVHDLVRRGAAHFTLPLHRRDPLSIWRNAGRLEALIREHGVDLVHARSRAPAWAALLAARRAGVAFVTTFHGSYNFAPGPAGALKRRYNAVMARGERVIAISEFIARHIREHYPEIDPARLRVVQRGVDLARFDPHRIHRDRIVSLAGRWLMPDGLPVVMLPGRLTRWKGHTVLIEALAQLQHRDFCCVLVGDEQGRSAYREELEQLIVARGLGQRVFIRGDCNDMPAAYMLADVVVSASTDPEAFGRVASEAQAMGRPFVGTAHGGVPEQVLPGETAYLAAPGDPDDMAQGLAWALDLRDLERRALAATARARAERFSMQEMCRKTLAVYDELLRPGGESATSPARGSCARAPAE